MATGTLLVMAFTIAWHSSALLLPSPHTQPGLSLRKDASHPPRSMASPPQPPTLILPPREQPQRPPPEADVPHEEQEEEKRRRSGAIRAARARMRERRPRTDAPRPPLAHVAITSPTRTSGAANVSTGVQAVDLEDGVRRGSMCPSVGIRGVAKSRVGTEPCPVAADVVPTLDAAAAEEGAGPATPVCLFTSLTEAYVEGHELFVRTALTHMPSLSVPLYVLDQALSARARERVAASYRHTRWAAVRGAAKDVARVTKFALNKEKTALFGLRAECGAVLKIDSGDMLVLDGGGGGAHGGGLGALLAHEAVLEASSGRSREVWATQAMGQPNGKINGGLMLFGRYWLHRVSVRPRALG